MITEELSRVYCLEREARPLLLGSRRQPKCFDFIDFIRYGPNSSKKRLADKEEEIISSGDLRTRI